MKDLAAKAIKAALNQKWKDAVELNLQILSSHEHDIDALNRIGRAYMELGKLTKAKATYKKVLALDNYNPIAQRNLTRINILSKQKKGTRQKGITAPMTKPAVLLEEPGKTKVVPVIRLADRHVLSLLKPTDLVLLTPKSRRVSVTLQDGTYVGALPDDVSKLLLFLMKGGNKYEAYVKEVRTNALQVFIREVFKSKKFGGQPSFVTNIAQHYYSFVRKDTASEEE